LVGYTRIGPDGPGGWKVHPSPKPLQEHPTLNIEHRTLKLEPSKKKAGFPALLLITVFIGFVVVDVLFSSVELFSCAEV
jgi:hypothetical protein